jgi:hypothetical protein
MSVVSGCVWDRLVQKTQLLILAFYALNKLYIIIITIIIIISLYSFFFLSIGILGYS